MQSKNDCSCFGDSIACGYFIMGLQFYLSINNVDAKELDLGLYKFNFCFLKAQCHASLPILEISTNVGGHVLPLILNKQKYNQYIQE
jgi:hypothetical protein